MRAEVLRLGHRPGRDERLTSHVGLTSRAFGAEAFHLAGDRDSTPLETVDDISRRFGGRFEARSERSPRSLVRGWPGAVVHLTMYGEPLQDVVEDLRGSNEVLAVVGSRKVQGWAYDESDYNVAVTSQPHSEVAALAVFLHELFEGRELELEFEGGEVEVVPSESGKRTRRPDEE